MKKNVPHIVFEDVKKSYGSIEVIKGVSFSINKNSLVSLVGLSGSGKTTLLRTINKLENIQSGKIKINNKNIDKIPLFNLRTSIGYVVQTAGLFPHITVKHNLQLVRKIQLKKQILNLKKKFKKEVKNKDKEDVKKLKEELKIKIDNKKNKGKFSLENFQKSLNILLKETHLKKELLEKKPNQLSGGQRQRVGIMRAFLTNAQIILMDEPFSALDPIVRRALQKLIYKMKDTHKKTIVFVTHSPEEALVLSDKIIILKNGKIHLETTTKKIKKSKDKFVRRFFLLDDNLEDALDDD